MTAAFDASRTAREREIERKVDMLQWADDWTQRAKLQTSETMAERRDPSKCKERPKDSRNNRGGSGDADTRQRFVPWCDRKS